ncbi:quinone oxidoreductase-like 2 [Crotalus adamanteus]|uniref:Acyltransferase n=1 Tax=Crotalus adamanteus TaxID=8729 RepID=A0AAW1C5Y0_CROAD
MAIQKGAVESVNYSEASLKEEVKKLTANKGVDVVIDTVGGDIFKQALHSLAFEGRIVVVGFAGGTIPSIPANILLLKNISALGIFWGRYRDEKFPVFSSTISSALSYYQEGQIQPQIGKVFKLEEPGVEVFVDSVPGGAPWVELRDLFEAAVPGVVVKVALMKQFAFIQLCDEVAAECAIQKLNGHLLHCHRVVVVEFSRPRPTHTVKTFVGNVSATCTSGELRVLFQEFGPVIECHIVKGVGEASLWLRNLLCTCSEVLLLSPLPAAIPAIEINSALRSPSLTSRPAVAGLTLHNCWMSGEAIDELHERYLEKLTQVFEEHKAKYGLPQDKYLMIT